MLHAEHAELQLTSCVWHARASSRRRDIAEELDFSDFVGTPTSISTIDGQVLVDETDPGKIPYQVARCSPCLASFCPLAGLVRGR